MNFNNPLTWSIYVHVFCYNTIDFQSMVITPHFPSKMRPCLEKPNHLEIEFYVLDLTILTKQRVKRLQRKSSDNVKRHLSCAIPAGQQQHYT